MCRLFGLYANRAVNVNFSFYEAEKSLEKLSIRNPHGWGIAWFDNGWNLHKEPGPLYLSKDAQRLAKNVSGIIVISHVRYATHGKAKLENTHPWLYKGYVFAHNGTIDKRNKVLELLSPEYRDLEGDTDSEALFHLIIQEADETNDFVEGVERAIAKINANNISYDSLNFIASDGKKLYALRYTKEGLNRYTLFYLKRPREGLRLEGFSAKTAQLIRMKLASGEKAIIVASEKYTKEPWEYIPNKHMLIIDARLNTELINISYFLTGLSHP
jgi:glutamine amidotransferase